MDSTNALNAVETPTGMSSATAVNHPLVTATGEQCPSCGTTIAADQRYCLNCGQRCGEPRLPFMNAVTFMDVMKRPKTAAAAPPAANSKRWRVSPNTALIASVGTLILAMGVGVLIGRSSEHSVTSTPAAAQIIKVPAGGGAETTTASTHKAAGGDGANSKAKKQSAAALKKEATTQKGAEEVLKPSAGVKLPPATVKPGGSCSSGTAGCKGGEFTGEYFGE